jgi:DNA replication protein DnaC
MPNLHHLQPQLKRLRLGGVLDTLAMRLDQAEQGHLGYLQFLELLLEDEIARREQRGLALRLAQAHFEELKTLEAFDFAFNPKIPAAKIHDLATCHFVAAGESVIVCGPVGTGKSHILQAIGHCACRQGYRVLYMRANRLLAHLAGGHADGTWESRLRSLVHPDLLLIDDFCLRELTPQQAEDVFELVGERHRRLSMMIASNRAPQDWYPLFPNPVLAEGVLDRLINRSHHLLLEGRSYRPLLRPDRADADHVQALAKDKQSA